MASINDKNNPNIQTKERTNQDSLAQKKIEDEVALRKKAAKELANYEKALSLQNIQLTEKERKSFQKKLLDSQRKEQEKIAKQLYKDYLRYDEKRRQEDVAQRKKEIEDEVAWRKSILETNVEANKLILGDKDASLGSKLKAMGSIMKDSFKLNASEMFNGLMKTFDQAMKQTMDAYSKYQSTIDTRLQGSSKTFKGLQKTLLNNVGITPYVKTQAMLDNLQALVQQGISYNVEQRAFLQTISDKVAATFDAANSSLLEIVRLQQSDSTASRLGMENYLNRFLNNMFESTEYLTNSFDTVTTNLVDAIGQMSTESGVEFEYIVQKWLGSLSSVGMSTSAIGSISQALGYLATGDVSGLESSGMQNLMVMAASRAGLSYADMLTRGINIDETNKLLESMVVYLQEIGSSTNQVVKNQYASTFGVGISDLRAAGNLSNTDIENISKNLLSYKGSISNLQSAVGTIDKRISLAEKLSNVKDNAMFSLFSNIASSPGLYSLWEITDLIQGVTGGINIPSVSVLGTGVDLNTTVENLMKLGVIGAGSLGMIGDIVSGVSGTFNFEKSLSRLGIGNKVSYTSRGEGISSLKSGFSTSESQYVGQQGSGDFYEATLKKAKMAGQEEVQSQKEQSTDKTTNDVYELLQNTSIVKITDSDLQATQNKLDYLDSINQTLLDIKNMLSDGITVNFGGNGGNASIWEKLLNIE